eukprot:364712-Chlamydomonas_euryale.AAC.1
MKHKGSSKLDSAATLPLSLTRTCVEALSVEAPEAQARATQQAALADAARSDGQRLRAALAGCEAALADAHAQVCVGGYVWRGNLMHGCGRAACGRACGACQPIAHVPPACQPIAHVPPACSRSLGVRQEACWVNCHCA